MHLASWRQDEAKMSIKVREWLRRLGIDTTHEEREEIDREIERKTGQYCDKGVELLSEAEFLAIVDSVRRRRKKRIAEPLVA
jgi:hypothetical protein